MRTATTPATAFSTITLTMPQSDVAFARTMAEKMGWTIEKDIDRQAKELRPYTMKEIHQMVEEGRQQIANGHYLSSEEVFRDLFRQFNLNTHEVDGLDEALEEKALQMNEAI